MAADLPQEIIADILSRLSVRDLLCYRSVEKQWCSLIDGPEFVKLHLDYAMKTPSRLGVVINDNDLDDLYWMNLDYPNVTEYVDDSIYEGYTRFRGSCNGLLLLQHTNFRYPADMIILNPSTGCYRELPTPLIQRRISLSGSRESYGFGYDHVGDDYKLLRLVQSSRYLRDYFESYAELYSANTNSWKMISLPYYLLDSCYGHGVFTCNALHWVACQNPKLKSMVFIVAFDLEKEEFLEVPMPSFQDQPSEIYLLDVLGESLCAVCNFFIPVSDVDVVLDLDFEYDSKSERVDVWVMKEYSVKDSWTKLFSVVPTEQTGLFLRMKPVCYLRALAKDQILLVQDFQKFILYDLAGKRVQDVDFFEPSGHMKSIACVESLVGLDELEGHSGWKK